MRLRRGMGRTVPNQGTTLPGGAQSNTFAFETGGATNSAIS